MALALALSLLPTAAWAAEDVYADLDLVGTPSDYSEPDNWLAIPEITKAADTVYFYPTAYADPTEDAADICTVDNDSMREKAQELYEQQATAFADATNVFAPYYRQSNIFAVMRHTDDAEAFQKNEQRTDVFAALDDCFAHYNNGRPFILAGHSQVSMMIRIVLDEYMPLHPELAGRLIAAYAIGESFPKDWLAAHPSVKFAEGADDTGVIVSWNTEGPGNKDANNFVVEAGAVSINPINWKRDNTYAPASENLGSRSQNEAGEWAVGAGVINGSGGMLSPKAIVTRAQAAAIFMRYADATTPIRVIDMEHHYYAQAFLDAAEKRAEVPRYNSKTREIEYVDGVVMNLAPIMGGLLSMDDERIAQMDAAGITAAMLETSPGLEQIGGAEGVALCKACNDLVYETMQKYPGRFCGSATLPVWDVEASVAELERCAKEYGFVSWHTHSNYGGTYIDDEVYRPLLKKCAELGVYVYIHPTMPANERLNERGVNFSAAGLGFTLDTMTTITAMITRGVFDEIPDLHVVSGHFGEALPFLLTRMDFHFGAWKNDPMLLNQHDISYYFKHNIWVTTSGNMSAEAFQLTKDVMGIERIMVGTDHPYENMAEEMAFLESLDLTRAEREALYYKNAAALMGVGG